MTIRKEVLSSPTDIAGNDGFLGPVNHTTPILVDLTQFTNKEIDSDGNLKPYIPLNRDGTMIGVGDFAYGVTVEKVKVASDNEDATIAALGDQDIAVALIACVVRDIAEDWLDRAYTADELASFDAAGSKIVLID